MPSRFPVTGRCVAVRAQSSKHLRFTEDAVRKKCGVFGPFSSPSSAVLSVFRNLAVLIRPDTANRRTRPIAVAVARSCLADVG